MRAPPPRVPIRPVKPEKMDMGGGNYHLIGVMIIFMIVPWFILYLMVR